MLTEANGPQPPQAEDSSPRAGRTRKVLMLKDFPETAVLRDFHNLTDRDPSSEYPKVFIRTAQRLAFMEFEDEESATNFFRLYRNGGVQIAGGNASVEWSRRTEVETQKEINEKLAKTKTCRCVLVHVMAVKTDFNVERVKEVFSPCGNLVKVAMWKDENRPDVQKMCLEFQHPEGAARAVEQLDERKLHPRGDLLRVTFSYKKELFINANSLFKVDLTRGPRLPSTPPNPKAPPPPPETPHQPATRGRAQVSSRERNSFPPPQRPHPLPSRGQDPMPSSSSRHAGAPGQPRPGGPRGVQPGGPAAESEKPFLRGRRHREKRGVLEPGLQPPPPWNEQTRRGPSYPDMLSLSAQVTREGGDRRKDASALRASAHVTREGGDSHVRSSSPMQGRGRGESAVLLPRGGSGHPLPQAGSAPGRGEFPTLADSPSLTPQGEQHQNHQQQSPRILRLPSQQQQEQEQAPRSSVGTRSFHTLSGCCLSGASTGAHFENSSATPHRSPLLPAPFLPPTGGGESRQQPARDTGEWGHRDEGERVAWGISKELSAASMQQQLLSLPSRPLPFQIPTLPPISGLSPSAIPLRPLHLTAAAGTQQEEQKPEQGRNRNNTRQEVQRAETGQQHGLTTLFGSPVLLSSSPSDIPPVSVPLSGSVPMSSLGMPIGPSPIRSPHSPPPCAGTPQQTDPQAGPSLAQGLAGGTQPQPESTQSPLQEQSPEQIQQALLCLLQNVLAQQQQQQPPGNTATGLADPPSQRLPSASSVSGITGIVPEQAQTATVPAAQPQPQRAPLTPANLPLPLSQQPTAPALPSSLSNPPGGWVQPRFAAETPFPAGLPESTLMGSVPPGAGTLTPAQTVNAMTTLMSPYFHYPQLLPPVFPHIPASAILFAQQQQQQQQQQDEAGSAGGTGFGLGGVGVGGLLGFSFVDPLTAFVSSSSPMGSALGVLGGGGSGSGETAGVTVGGGHSFPCMGLQSGGCSDRTVLPFLSPCSPLNAFAVQLEGGHCASLENSQGGGIGQNAGAGFHSNNVPAPMNRPTVDLCGPQQTLALCSREAASALASGLKPSAEGPDGAECEEPEETPEQQQQQQEEEQSEAVDELRRVPEEEEEEGEGTGREEETETDGTPAMSPGSASSSTGTRRAIQSLEGRQMHFSTFPLASLKHSSYSSDRELNGDGGEEDERKAGGQSD